jgi:hypothetical protein
VWILYYVPFLSKLAYAVAPILSCPLTRPGADPGPAGQRLLAWRELSARSVGHWRSSFKVAAAALGVAHDEALQEAVDAAEAGAGDKQPAPFAAARVFGLARRTLTQGAQSPSAGGRGGEGELIAAWLADCVLAQRLKWPFALPLLATALFSGTARYAGGGRNRCRDGDRQGPTHRRSHH